MVHGFQNDTAHIRVSLEKGLVQLPEPLHGLLGPLQGMGGIVLGVVGGLSPQFRLGAGLLEFRQLVFQMCIRRDRAIRKKATMKRIRM